MAPPNEAAQAMVVVGPKGALGKPSRSLLPSDLFEDSCMIQHPPKLTAKETLLPQDCRKLSCLARQALFPGVHPLHPSQNGGPGLLPRLLPQCRELEDFNISLLPVLLLDRKVSPVIFPPPLGVQKRLKGNGTGKGFLDSRRLLTPPFSLASRAPTAHKPG